MIFVIGDGDSSVMKRLNEILPYGPRFMIEKIECRNHLLRNYISKLKMLATKTEYPVIIPKFIVTNILRFRSDVTKAITYQKNILDKSKNQKIAGNLYNIVFLCTFLKLILLTL